MTEPLNTAELNALRRIASPAVSNAIETFDTRPRDEGFFDRTIRCILPELGAMVGYAVTATIRATTKPPTGAPGLKDMVEHMTSVPKPYVVVIQDMDWPDPIGSFWGEVNGNVHKALGAVGVLTNGGVRDLDEVRQLGFHFFASCLLVSHAYVHLESVGGPVEVGGLTVRPGDLIHGDQHGALIIPPDIAREIPRAAAVVEERERKIIDYAQSPDMTIEGLLEIRRTVQPISSTYRD